MLIKMNILLIGYGYWGKIWEKTIKKSNHNLIGIVDPMILKNGIEDYKIFDTVIIATPINTHLKIVNSLPSVKNLLIEKPGTSNLVEFNKIKIEKFKNIGAGYLLLYCHGIQEIKKINQNWKISFFNRSNGCSQIRKDCDVVYDLLCHDLSIAYYIFNTFPEILFVDRTNDRIICLLKFNDCICNFYCSRIDYEKKSNVCFINDDKTYSYDDIKKELVINENEKKKVKNYSDSPLDSQLEALNNNLLTDLNFAKNIHLIMKKIILF